MSDFSAAMQAVTGKVQGMAPFGKSVKFMLDDHVAVLDGNASPPTLQLGEGEGDIVLKTSLDTFQKLLSKDLSPTLAFMTGKIKIEGDLQAALPLLKMF